MNPMMNRYQSLKKTKWRSPVYCGYHFSFIVALNRRRVFQSFGVQRGAGRIHHLTRGGSQYG